MHFIARAITPPRRPRRYDTRFFTADASAIAHRIEGKVGPDAELIELKWIPLDTIKEHVELLVISEIVLRDLKARIEAGFSHDLPVPILSRAARQTGSGPAVGPRTRKPDFLDFGAPRLRLRPTYSTIEVFAMAKAVTTKIKLVSSADTGFYYVTKKNSRTMTEKLKMKKYDPIAKKHVEFVEGKIK